VVIVRRSTPWRTSLIGRETHHHSTCAAGRRLRLGQTHIAARTKTTAAPREHHRTLQPAPLKSWSPSYAPLSPPCGKNVTIDATSPKLRNVSLRLRRNLMHEKATSPAPLTTRAALREGAR